MNWKKYVIVKRCKKGYSHVNLTFDFPVGDDTLKGLAKYNAREVVIYLSNIETLGDFLDTDEHEHLHIALDNIGLDELDDREHEAIERVQWATHDIY